MAVRVNATQNGILGPQTQLELTCTSTGDWTLQGYTFRTICEECSLYAWKWCPLQWNSLFSKVSDRHGRISNARRNRVELVFTIFGCNFSLAFQRAKESSNPSSYAKVMVVRVNATQNGILGPRTQLELTCTSSYDWTLQGHRFRTIVMSVGCTHGSDVLFNGTRRSRKFHARHGRIPNARRNGVELVFCDFRM